MKVFDHVDHERIHGSIQCDGYAGYAREVDGKNRKSVVAVPPERRRSRLASL